MVESSSLPQAQARLVDLPTVVALSALATIIAVFLHEALGHGLSCVLLGGRLTELGAFYVNCDRTGVSGLSSRLIALDGPLVSLLTGVIGYALLARLQQAGSSLRFLLWLLGTIGLLQASGYLLFSGIGGVGDLGTEPDAVLYQLSPEWAWRLAITVLGGLGYALVIWLALRRLDWLIGGGGAERVQRAQRLALTAYLTGGVVSVLIGVLNPHGLAIVLLSAVASSLGGGSALAWMAHMLDRTRETGAPPLRIGRSWAWLAAGLLATLLYTLILGPTIYL